MTNNLMQPKVLRIGVIQNGKIIEERLLKKHGSVTIGQAPRNTFVLPVQLPHFTLFEFKGGRYFLVFTEEMDGRVSVQNAVVDLKTLRTKGIAKQRGHKWYLPLSEKTRGKVLLRDVTLLFQFVNRPPAIPKPQLPAIVKGNFLSNVDWGFGLVMLFCFICLVGSGVWADIWWTTKGQYLPRYEKDNPLLDNLRNPAQVRIKEDEKKKDKKPDLKAKKKSISNVKIKTKVKMKTPIKRPKIRKIVRNQLNNKTRSLAQMRKHHRRMTKHVRNKTFLHMLGSTGPGKGLFSNNLHKGLVSRRISDALSGNTRLKVARDGDTSRYRDVGPKYKGGNMKLQKFSISKHVGSRTIRVANLGNRDTEIKIRGIVKTQSGNKLGGLGKLDKSSVSKVIRRRLSRIRACYERGLKGDPKLSGKVVVRFTISESGRVSTATLSANSVGGMVGGCIRAAIARMKFSKPDGGSVTFSYPFLFLPKG